MAIASAELLANDNIDGVSRLILQVVALLDDFGAQTWDLRIVGVATSIFLFGVRLAFNKKYGVDWYALLHALVTGLGSMGAVYLDMVASETLTGTAEPLRSCQCEPPLTSLHRILPAITMGYAIFDMIDGLTLGIDFAAHGVMTFIIMAFYVESDLPQIVMPFLLMEVSTIFLTIVRATFFTETMTMMTQALFALNFFVFRIVLTPLVWCKLMWTMYDLSGTELYQSCFNIYALPVSIVIGLFFHCLNAFWFYKIIRKIKRKMSGKEKIHANNDLKESESQQKLNDAKKKK
jgi:hypothetical protein